MENLEEADAMLVVGSSLMVYSGFRFVQAAARICRTKDSHKVYYGIFIGDVTLYNPII